jgi:putative ABC transport system permease protein
MYAVKMRDPAKASEVVERINAEFPEASAALSSDFVDQMPDFNTTDAMIGGISFLAIAIGGVGVLNTMLMSVFERTREIGVLRALGWRRKAILGLIMREAFWLGLLGGVAGIAFAFGFTYMISLIPLFGSALMPLWEWQMFARAIVVALSLGVVGGLYPAYRATRLLPVEALRYE